MHMRYIITNRYYLFDKLDMNIKNNLILQKYVFSNNTKTYEQTHTLTQFELKKNQPKYSTN